jgi:hypothetical protein
MDEKRKEIGFVVCPQCGLALPSAAVMPEKVGERGIIHRTYLGWCHKCDIGIEVIQYKALYCWIIEKWRTYQDVCDQPVPSSDWHIETNLPDINIIGQANNQQLAAVSSN